MTSLFGDQEISIEECILLTHIERLSVLTSGSVPPNPAELLSSIDGVIFVIPKGGDNKDEMIRSAEQLNHVKANVLGFIMNKVEKLKKSYSYHYDQ